MSDNSRRPGRPSQKTVMFDVDPLAELERAGIYTPPSGEDIEPPEVSGGYSRADVTRTARFCGVQ